MCMCSELGTTCRTPNGACARAQGSGEQLHEGRTIHSIRSLSVRGAHPGVGHRRHSPLPHHGAGLGLAFQLVRVFQLGLGAFICNVGVWQQ